MSNKGKFLSLPLRVLLIGIYFFYFMVQLQLQFVSSEAPYKGFPERTGLATGTVKSRIHASHCSTVEITRGRLNKRYSPENVFALIPAQVLVMGIYPQHCKSSHPFGRNLATALFSSNLFRGPPVTA